VQRLNRCLATHARVWDELNDRRFESHPLLSSAFVDGLLCHFGDGTEYLCWLEAGGGVDAMCILCRRSWWHWASFLPSQAQISPSLIANATQTNGLIRSLPGYVLAVDLLCLDPAVSYFPVSTSRTMHWHQALTMAVETCGGFDDYWSRRPANLRNNMRRYENRIAANFDVVRYECITDPSHIDVAVERYAMVEIRGWKGAQGTALHPENEQGRFYRELLVALARRGRAEVHELWFGDRLAASRLIVGSEVQKVVLKTTYDETLAKYAPGRILLKRLLARMFEQFPERHIEFYTNATRDQLAWATSSRPIRHVRRFRHNAATLALTGMRAVRDTVRRVHIPKGLSVAVYHHPDALPPKAHALLQEAEARDGIELGIDWLRLLVEHVYTPPAQPRLFVLSRDDETLAVLPMVLAEPRSRELGSLAHFYTALSCPIVQQGVEANDLVALVDAIRRAGPRVARFNFGPMDPEGWEYGLWRTAIEHAGLVPFRYFRFGHWSLDARGMNFRQYLATRDGAIRNTIMRMSKRFAAQHGKIELVLDSERVEHALAAYERVYAASWKRAEPYPDFIRELVRLCARRGWLRLGIAWLGNMPVAAQCWIVAHGRAAIFKLAYDESFKHLSAGTLLTARLMEYVIDADCVREVDYLIGDDPYKRGWMSHRDERWGIIAYDPLHPSGLLRIIQQLVGTATRGLRSQPKSNDN